MSAVAFDTYAAVKTLREAGADEAMAEAIVNTASAAAEASQDELATKADLATLEARLTNTLATKAELRAAVDPLASKSDLAAVIAGVRAELGILRWAVGLSAAFLLAIVVRVFGLI